MLGLKSARRGLGSAQAPKVCGNMLIGHIEWDAMYFTLSKEVQLKDENLFYIPLSWKRWSGEVAP